MPYLIKDRLIKYLYEPEMNIRLKYFYKNYIPDMNEIPFIENSEKDIFLQSNDLKFHKYLVNILKS